MATESQDVEMQEVPFDALNFVKNIIVQQRTCSNNTLELIQRMLDILQAQRISEDHAMDGSSVNLESPIKPEEIGKLESMRKNAAQSTKSLHAGIQDFGKGIEETFLPNVHRAYIESSPVGGHKLDEIILEHLVQEGKFDLGAMFMEEAGLQQSDNITAYMGMEEILGSMNHGDLGPVQRWASERQFQNPKHIHAHDTVTPLLLKLAIFEFHDLHATQGRVAAILYSRNHFGAFVDSHCKHLQAVVYTVTDKNHSQRWLESQRNLMLEDLKEEFKQSFCSALDKSKVSHLRQLVAAGTKALPDLVKMERLRQGSVSALNSEGTLPGLLELGPEFAIRSTFNCPVDKTQANAGNPPVALPCGHLIGKNALTNLSQKSTTRSVKCPYCPVQGFLSDCKEVKLTG